MILNLERFNQYVAYHHFKKNTLYTVIKLMKPGCYMASTDLRDVYYTVAIHPDHQKYLKFVANGELYQYTCPPNRLASAPSNIYKTHETRIQHAAQHGSDHLRLY